MIEGLRPRAGEREAVEARRLAARERENILGLVEAGQLLVLPVLVHGEQALVVGGGVQVELGVPPLVRVLLSGEQHRLGHAAHARRTVRVSSSGTQARVAEAAAGRCWARRTPASCSRRTGWTRRHTPARDTQGSSWGRGEGCA